MSVLEDQRLIGSQTPTIHVVPPRVSSSGPEVCVLADQAGLVLDPWQRLVLQDALGERPDGKWSAFEVAVMVGRQNGKSAIFEARMLGGLFLLGERLVVYSAHEFKSAVQIFKRMDELIAGTSTFRRRVRSVSKTRGEEGFVLTTGQELRFLARSTGAGRGFTADCLIWDECQNLGDGPVDAQMPILSARPNPQLWYGGSAPDYRRAPCEQIARVRKRALSGAARDLAYFEWSASLCGDLCVAGCADHDDPADLAVWAKTNPGMGIRLDPERIRREHESMSSAGFNRERLTVGRYPPDGRGWDVISEDAWVATADPRVLDEDGTVLKEGSKALDPVAFAIDVNPERTAASIAVAGIRPDGLIHIELIAHWPGTDWVLDRVRSLNETWKPCAIALDASGPAGSLCADFEEADIKLAMPRARDVAGACGALYDSVVRPPDAPAEWRTTLRHVPHASLTAALTGAAKRPLGAGGSWAWDRRGASVDISPLMAVSLARWAYVTRPKDGPIQMDGALMA